MDELTKYFTEIPLILGLGSARVGVVLTIAPIFLISGMPRQALMIAVIGAVVPMILPTLPQGNFNPTYIWVLVLKELFVGTLIAYFISIIFWGLEIAGELIDLQRGTTAGGIFNPMLGAQESPMGGLLLRLAGYVFFSIGGFVSLLGVLFASYQVYPIGDFLPPFLVGWQNHVFPFLTDIFQLGIIYASPLLIIFFFMDFGLGLMNRFVSQLNVFFLSLPIKSGICFVFMTYYMNYVMEGFQKDLFTESGVAVFLKTVFK
ncbi:MAG: type III secretion system export apparatus subunit SctT [Chthoniobacterales bacterium]|nr:type III secretion system export apparatus subunit SctT [Chthoniobacterales bacterium]